MIDINDFSDKRYFKNLALDTEFDCKLSLVTEIKQHAGHRVFFEVSYNDTKIYFGSDIQWAFEVYNKMVRIPEALKKEEEVKDTAFPYGENTFYQGVAEKDCRCTYPACNRKPNCHNKK